ncbi:hypothetical protein DL93DRAFT_2167581 [Clavulina sp. PMI_390]|nr:hypothetical protein DL93DRAFT_2167581 [Clavulina sp. PMI_390]
MAASVLKASLDTLPLEILIAIIVLGRVDVHSLIRLSWASKHLNASIMLNRSIWLGLVRTQCCDDLIPEMAIPTQSLPLSELKQYATRKPRFAWDIQHAEDPPVASRHDFVLKLLPRDQTSATNEGDSTIPDFDHMSLVPGGRWMVTICHAEETQYLACWDFSNTQGSSLAEGFPVLFPVACVVLDDLEGDDNTTMKHTLYGSIWDPGSHLLSVVVGQPGRTIEVFQWDGQERSSFVGVARLPAAPVHRFAALSKDGQVLFHESTSEAWLWNWKTGALAHYFGGDLRGDSCSYYLTASGTPFSVSIHMLSPVKLRVTFVPLVVHSHSSADKPHSLVASGTQRAEFEYVFDELSTVGSIGFLWLPSMRTSDPEKIIVGFRTMYPPSGIFLFSVANSGQTDPLFSPLEGEDGPPFSEGLMELWTGPRRTHVSPRAFWLIYPELSKGPPRRGLRNKEVLKDPSDVVETDPLQDLDDSDEEEGEHVICSRPCVEAKDIVSFPTEPSDWDRHLMIEGFCPYSGTWLIHKRVHPGLENPLSYKTSFALVKYS